MANRMETGIGGLDRVLCGGFLYHNSILLKGAPGCGKTTLGMQIIVNGALAYGEPGVVILFEQFPQQLFRDVKAYGWDLEDMERRKLLRMIFATPDQLITHDRSVDPPLLSKMQNAAHEIGAKRILVDSVSHILNSANEPYEARQMLLKFINMMKSMGLTPVMTAEAEGREGAIGVDEYLSDEVLLLTSEGSQDKTFAMRQLQVRKTRGHDHMRGRHAIKLSDSGFEVFPRVPALPEEEAAATVDTSGGLRRLGTGIGVLDEILGGGVARGTATIIAGMPGTFKTTLGVQFATKGLGKGEKSLIISFTERPTFLVRIMAEKGLPLKERLLDGTVDLWHIQPKEIAMEELLYRLGVEMDKGHLTRLVVDGLNEVERSIEDPAAYKDIITGLLALCATHRVTAMFTQKLDKFTGSAPLTDVRYADMFDGIIYLGAIEIESSVHKVISVLKMRGGNYQSDLREIVCDENGLKVMQKFVGMTGILSGNAQGQYKKTVEELFQPLYFVRDFIDMAATEDLPAEQQKAIIVNVQSEVAKLVDKLKTHFDVKN